MQSLNSLDAVTTKFDDTVYLIGQMMKEPISGCTMVIDEVIPILTNSILINSVMSTLVFPS